MICPRCNNVVDPGHKLCSTCEMDEEDDRLGAAQSDSHRYRRALARLVAETDLTPAQAAIIREAGLH